MSFKAIIGQSRALDLIIRQLRSGCLKGSYLFLGPRGTGKLLTALTLAKALNCQNQEFDSCDICSSCKRIDSFNYPDVFVIERRGGDSQIRIDCIRSMLDRIVLRPFEGRWKVFIIRDAEGLTAEAASCLLKILEEPLDDSLIILTSSNPGLILPTVLSRCKKIPFGHLPTQDVYSILFKEYHLDKDKSRFLAQFSEGSLGEALKLKDLDILSIKNNIIDTFLLGSYFTMQTRVFDDERKNLKFTLGVLIVYLRDLWMLKIGNAERLINTDRKSLLESMKDKYSFEELYTAFGDLSRLAYFTDRNINPKLIFNFLRLRLCKR